MQSTLAMFGRPSVCPSIRPLDSAIASKTLVTRCCF